MDPFRSVQREPTLFRREKTVELPEPCNDFSVLIHTSRPVIDLLAPGSPLLKMQIISP